MPEKVIFFCLFKLRKRRFYDLLRDFYIYRSYTCFFIKKIWKKYMTFNAFFFQKSHMVIFREIKNMTFFDDSFIKSHTFMFEMGEKSLSEEIMFFLAIFYNYLS